VQFIAVKITHQIAKMTKILEEIVNKSQMTRTDKKIKEKAFEIRTMFLKLQMLISFFASMPHIIIKYTFSDL